MAGAEAGERWLYITLSETEEELRDSARPRTAGTSTGIEIFELVPPESLLDEQQQQSLLYSSDLELGETTRRIFEAVERIKPDARGDRQPVGDPPAGAELAALSPPDPGAEALFRASTSATVLMLDDLTTEAHRQDRAQRRPRRDPAGGAGARTTAPSGGACGWSNIAAGAFAAAIHDFVIETGGVRGLSRGWSRPSTGRSSSASPLPSGIAGLDALLGGGVERGSSALILGPGGHRQVAAGAQLHRRGGRARREGGACSSSTRSSGLLFERAKGLGIDLQAMVDQRRAGDRAGRRRRAVAGRVHRPGARLRRAAQAHGPW